MLDSRIKYDSTNIRMIGEGRDTVGGLIMVMISSIIEQMFAIKSKEII